MKSVNNRIGNGTEMYSPSFGGVVPTSKLREGTPSLTSLGHGPSLLLLLLLEDAFLYAAVVITHKRRHVRFHLVLDQFPSDHHHYSNTIGSDSRTDDTVLICTSFAHIYPDVTTTRVIDKYGFCLIGAIWSSWAPTTSIELTNFHRTRGRFSWERSRWTCRREILVL